MPLENTSEKQDKELEVAQTFVQSIERLWEVAEDLDGRLTEALQAKESLEDELASARSELSELRGR